MNAADIAREERIENLKLLTDAAFQDGDTKEARAIFSELRAALRARSTGAVAYLEAQLTARIGGEGHGR